MRAPAKGRGSPNGSRSARLRGISALRKARSASGRTAAACGSTRLRAGTADDGLREYVRDNLELEGYTVREAGSAEEGMRVLDDARPDLILLDVMMPEVDGWEMLQRVHDRHGGGAVPVVMFSGKLDERAADEAAERGAQGFVGKPFDPRELIAQTKQLLSS